MYIVPVGDVPELAGSINLWQDLANIPIYPFAPSFPSTIFGFAY